MGIKTHMEQLGGDVNGTWMSAITIGRILPSILERLPSLSTEPQTLKRSYATSVTGCHGWEAAELLKRPQAFLDPILDRVNLFVLTGANVTKLLFHEGLPDGGRPDLGATEVEFQHDGVTLRVTICREVILCAGCNLSTSAIRQPSIET